MFLSSQTILRTCALLAALLALSCSGMAQTSYHIGVEDGLSGNNLSTIIRSHDGYMWFGSYNGVMQHQGNRIRVFNRVGNDSLSLSSSDVNAVCEDHKGQIWLGTTGGLDRLDPRNGRVRHYSLRSGPQNSRNYGWIYSVFEDREQTIWATSDAAIFRISPESGKYKCFYAGTGPGEVPATSTGYHQGPGDASGFLLSTAHGIIRYNYKTKAFEHQGNHPDPLFRIENGTGGSAGSDFCTDDSGRIYFVANGKLLVRYTMGTRRIDTIPFQRPPGAWGCCYSLIQDHRGTIWIGFRNGGLLLYTPSDGRFRAIRAEMQDRLIRTNYIYSLAEDYQHRMWVTTNEGVDVIDYYQSGMQLYHLSDTADFRNLVHASGAMTLDAAGWLQVPFYNSKFFAFHTGSRRKITAEMQGHKLGGIPYSAVLSNGSGHEARSADTAGPIIPEFVSHRKPANTNVVWHYESAGIRYEKYYDDTLLRIERDGRTSKLPTFGYIPMACVAADGKSIYFFGQDLNIVRQHIESGKIDTFDIQSALAKAGIVYAFPRSLEDDGNGSIWVTTQTGMLRFNLMTKEVTYLTTSEGLSHNFCFSALVDKKGLLWVSSLGGVDWFDRSTGTFRNVIRYRDGTYLDAFGSSLRTADGALYFNIGNRLLRIRPDSYFRRPPIPLKLMLHEIYVNGNQLSVAADPALAKLGPSENRLMFRYGLLDFGMPKSSIRLQYRLEGSETAWTGDERGEVSYNGLPPGSYSFQLRALAPHSDTVLLWKEVPFRIRPPFWQTWWARCIALLSIAAVITYLVRRRIAAIRRKSDLKLHITELESRALRAQMNPHFIFNSLNAIQELVIREDTTAAYEYLAKFSKLLRMVLQHSEHSSILLADELEMYRLYLDLESLRFNHTFRYAIRVEEPLDDEVTRIPPLLLQPYLENAIWHGLLHQTGDKTLDLRFYEDGECMVCVITDNGIGREAAVQLKQGSVRRHNDASRGLSLTEQRAHVFSPDPDCPASILIHDLQNDDGTPAGTQVIVRLPLNEARRSVAEQTF